MAIETSSGRPNAPDPPSPGDSRKLEALRARLRAIAFDERVVAGALGVSDLDGVQPDLLALHETIAGRRRDPAGVVVALFLAHLPLSRATVERALTPSLAHWLCDAGILAESGGELSACFDLYPCDGTYLLTDVRHAAMAPTRPPVQPVMSLGADSYALAYLAPRPRRSDTVLDLCTGSGVQAILAARHARHVIGVDLDPRAVAMARFNAALNGVAARCDLRRGDLYDAVAPERARGERFALVLANPPYVPTGATVREPVLHRDSGPTGYEVLSRIARGLGDHLSPAATACIVAVFPRRHAAADVERQLPRWLGRRCPATSVLLAFSDVSPEVHALACRRTFGESSTALRARYRSWLATYASQRIERFTFGVLALRRSERARPLASRSVVFPERPARTLVGGALDAAAVASVHRSV